MKALAVVSPQWSLSPLPSTTSFLLTGFVGLHWINGVVILLFCSLDLLSWMFFPSFALNWWTGRAFQPLLGGCKAWCMAWCTLPSGRSSCCYRHAAHFFTNDAPMRVRKECVHSQHQIMILAAAAAAATQTALAIYWLLLLILIRTRPPLIHWATALVTLGLRITWGRGDFCTLSMRSKPNK